jgi:hypothetical protein
MNDDDERIEERVRTYAGALHKRVLERVMHKAKLTDLGWIGPAWVENNYARELESLMRDDARSG